MGFLFGRTTTTRADKIGDFQINTASYGEVVPDILGTTRVSGNIIYWDDFTAHEHKQTQRTGKGGGSKHVNVSYTYSVAVCVALCEGPIAGIGQVWRNKDLYTYPHQDIELTLFNGVYEQEPWAYVQGKHPEKALPYSGLAYMAGVVDLGDQGGLPNFNFEVKGKLLDTGDGVDVNPADYIAYVVEQIGIEQSNIEGLEHFRAYCREADLLISTPPDGGSKKAQQIINDIAELTNSYLFWSQDRLKIVPLADNQIGNWSPLTEITYDLTADDFLPMNDGTLVSYRRKDTSECFNQATVEFINRANGYEKETVSFDVVADIQHNGMKPAPMKSIHYLYTKKRASYVAEQLAMQRLYARNQYVFKLDWAFCRLEPGDLVTLTDEYCGLNKRVVVITAITESADGVIEVTAVGKPPGTYSPARYDVHENERPYLDYNVQAPSITDITLLQTPGDVSGNEIMLGVTAPANWGGCNVWVSDTGDSYKQIGTIYHKARVGQLLRDMSAEDTTCHIRLHNGTLKSGTHIDAERGNTLCWIDGECLSYETATLQQDGSYILGGIIRGQYETMATEHRINEKIVRVDEALMRQSYRDEDVGKRIYIKCTSLNLFGSHEEDLSTVKVYEYTIQSYYIPNVKELALHTRYYELGNGLTSYDVIATFVAPNIKSFDIAEAWYREGDGEWKFGGVGNGQITISGCELGRAYEVKVKTKDKHGNYSQGVTKTIEVAMKTDVPNTPEGLSVTFGSTINFNWLEVRNADIDFYELRTNTAVGETNGLIGRSNNTSYTGYLPSRIGEVLLYAHNPKMGYSAPARCSYRVEKPQAPSNIVVKSVFGGLDIKFDAIPPMCNGAVIYANSEAYKMTTNVANLLLDPDVYRVKIAYTDVFGEGVQSEETLATVKAEIDPSWIHITDKTIFDDNVIVSRMLQANSVTADKMKVDSLSAITANMGTLTGGTIIGGRIQNADNSAYIDSNGNIYGMRITGGEISAEQVKANGKPLHNSVFATQTLISGEKLAIPDGYDINKTLIVVNRADVPYFYIGADRWSGVEESTKYHNYGKFWRARGRASERQLIENQVFGGVKILFAHGNNYTAKEKELFNDNIPKYTGYSVLPERPPKIHGVVSHSLYKTKKYQHLAVPCISSYERQEHYITHDGDGFNAFTGFIREGYFYSFVFNGYGLVYGTVEVAFVNFW